jgi:hypothetical protein
VISIADHRATGLAADAAAPSMTLLDDAIPPSSGSNFKAQAFTVGRVPVNSSLCLLLRRGATGEHREYNKTKTHRNLLVGSSPFQQGSSSLFLAGFARGPSGLRASYS